MTYSLASWLQSFRPAQGHPLVIAVAAWEFPVLNLIFVCGGLVAARVTSVPTPADSYLTHDDVGGSFPESRSRCPCFAPGVHRTIGPWDAHIFCLAIAPSITGAGRPGCDHAGWSSAQLSLAQHSPLAPRIFQPAFVFLEPAREAASPIAWSRQITRWGSADTSGRMGRRNLLS